MSWEYVSLKAAQKMGDLEKENKDIWNLYLKCVEERNKLQERIDKAIEYIKNNIAEEHYAIDFGLGTSRKWFNGNYLKIIEYLEGKNE